MPRAAPRARARRPRSPERASQDAAFRAVADATRRDLLVLLASGERSVNQLAAEFSVSRPAISKHLAVLRRSGLVRERRAGRERLYSLDSEPLQRMASWLGEVDRFWQDRLARLGRHLAEQP